MRVSIIILTLNEIDGMKAIMPKIKKEWYDQLIIVDGGSTDGTIEYAEHNGYDIFIQKTKGTGNAFREAVERATGDIIIPFSPDGNCLPEIIPLLVNKIKEGYDIVTASRYLKPAKSYDDDPVTAFGNFMFTKLFNLIYGANITDLLNMYRAYSRKAFSLAEGIKNDAFGTYILSRAIKDGGYKIIEISADEPKRIGGVRKMQPLRNGYLELRMLLTERFK